MLSALNAHLKQDTVTGLGRALRTARTRAGKSVEQASREMRVRPDYLEALEEESFEAFPDDVYVRGFLRSYARYLGLSQEKVISVYEQGHGRRLRPAPVERAPGVTPSEFVELTERKRASWFLAASAAAIVLAAAAAVGILSRSTAVPEPARVSGPPAASGVDRTVQVDVAPNQEVEVAIVADGEEQTLTLREGEARSFEAEREITIRLSEGGVVDLVVNGHRVQQAGERHQPYQATFTPASFREASSPAAPGT
jgi:cytoskeletal protein RodZ